MNVSLARDVTLTPIESGAVLLDGRRGRYWELNESGSNALQKLLDGDSIESAATGLFASAPVSDEQACGDLQALVDALQSANLVEVAP